MMYNYIMVNYDARRMLSFVRQACVHYDMIENGDKIAVGLSGGKDSTALLITLAAMRRFYPQKYELIAITVDMGFEGMDFSPIAAICKNIDVEYITVKSQIAKIIFDIRKESNPCALCAKMRRGILHDTAKANGCNKIALGHHHDDVVDTFMLNLIHEGRLGTFSPVTYLSRKDITMIRPLIYAKEKDIKYFISHNDIPVVGTTCPEDKHTEREEVKKLIADLDKKYNGFSHRIMNAIETSHLDGFSPCVRIRRTKDE